MAMASRLRIAGARVAGALALSLLSAAPGLTQSAPTSWPTRPVTLIIPFPAGGSTDVLGRALAEFVAGEIGQSVIIDNRGGAGGNIGATAVAKAQPDGYTLLLATPSIAATNKLMYANMAYDPDRAFAPIVLIGASPLIIATWPDAPYKLLAGLITFAKANAFVASEKSRALMQTIGVAPVGGTAAALKAHIAAEVAKWAPIIKAADIRF